jgi:hypothetical protein
MLIHFKSYKPLYYISGFNLLTILVFVTAPIQWKTDNLLLFVFFSFVCQLLIALGFKLGVNKAKYSNFRKKIFSQITKEQLNFIFLFYFLTFIFKYAYLLRFKPFEIVEMVQFLLIGIVDPQLGYYLSLDSTRLYTLPWSIYFVTSILNQIFFIIGFISWKQLNFSKKSFFLFFLFLEMFFWVGRGTNFGVISLVTTFLLATMLNLKVQRVKFKSSLKNFIFVLILSFLAVFSFTSTMISRAGTNDFRTQDFDLGMSVVDDNGTAFDIIPETFHRSYMYVVSYMSQGYYHTCLAFDLDYQPTYLLANNPALISLVEVFGINIFEDSYMYRLKEKGVDPLVNWHSAYTWFASDISFFGVPFLCFYIGYLFGFSWDLSINQNDFLSKLIFIVLGNVLIYIFANNSYLGSVFYSMMFIMPVWYFTRIKRLK